MNRFEWTLDGHRRMHPETWYFEWIPDGWRFQPPGWPDAFVIQPNGEPISSNHSESLTYALVNEAIDYPTSLPKALRALWEARKQHPSQDLSDAAEQLETWIKATPTDPIFNGVV